MPEEQQLDRLFADFLSRYETGGDIGIGDFCGQHPDHAQDLRRLWEEHRRVRPLVSAALPGGAQGFSFQSARSESFGVLGTGLEPGAEIGEFRLVRPIARGGMGEVWEAEQVPLERKVALKLILPERVSRDAQALFAREARAGGRLSHPGIVTIHSHGTSGGLAWIAMELVEGAWTLRDFVDEVGRAGELEGGYYEHVAEFIAQVADALQAAHDAGVIHRDVKPRNILITRDDRPKLTDFGLARITDEAALSVTGDFAGTYAYMSPEQVAAKRAGLDHRTDIFSLGVVLYEMLTLRRPFEGDTAHQIADQILFHEPRDPRKVRSRVPKDLGIIAGKAMEKRRDRRYASMEELAADLRRHLRGEPIRARPRRAWHRWSAHLKRHRAAAITVLAVLAGVSLAWRLSEAAAERRSRRELLDGVRAQLASAGEHLAADRVKESLDLLREAHTRFGQLPGREGLSAGETVQVEDVRTSLEGTVAAVHDRVRGRILAFLEQSVHDPISFDFARAFDHASDYNAVLDLLPEQADEIENVLEGVLPRVIIDSEPQGATVYATRLDSVTGLPVAGEQPTELGRTGLDVSIRPGFYHFRAVTEDGRYGEIVRLVYGMDVEYELPKLRLLDDEQVTRGMKRIEPGPFVVPLLESRFFKLDKDASDEERTVQLPGFYVDVHEVTNDQYKEFVLDTGRAPPWLWPEEYLTEDFPQEVGRRPVVCLTLRDAEAYAAWAGKRLLQFHEWSRAARGPNGRPFPWDLDPGQVAEPSAWARVPQPSARIPPQATPFDDLAARRSAWERYIQHTAPVGTWPGDRSRDGVMDTYGNVSELTAAMAISELAEGFSVPMGDTFRARGASWRYDRGLDDMMGVPPHATNDCVGFRCGKSLPQL